MIGYRQVPRTLLPAAGSRVIECLTVTGRFPRSSRGNRPAVARESIMVRLRAPGKEARCRAIARTACRLRQEAVVCGPAWWRGRNSPAPVTRREMGAWASQEKG